MVRDGVAVADHMVEAPSGAATLVILPTSSPSLRAGTYFIALGLFTKGAEVTGFLTATVSTTPPPPAPSAVTVLTSGVGVKFSLPPVPQNTLFVGNRSFRIDVPPGASRLTVELKADDPSVDTDLFVRFGQDNDVDREGNILADYAAMSRSGDETLVIDLSSQPPLVAGAYFISIGVFSRSRPASGVITATVERESFEFTSGTTLRSGIPVQFRLPAVMTPTLFAGRDGFQITVPEGATRLDIAVEADSPEIDLDLFVRFGAPPQLTPTGALLADYASFSESGNEEISIVPTSRPPLRAGTYHIGLGLFSLNTPATGSLVASISTEAAKDVPKDGVTLRPRLRVFLHGLKSDRKHKGLREKPVTSVDELPLAAKKKVYATEGGVGRQE